MTLYLHLVFDPLILKLYYSPLSQRNLFWDALAPCLSSLHCHLFNQQTLMHAKHHAENLGLVSEGAGPRSLFIFSNNSTNRSDPSMKMLWHPFILAQKLHPRSREGKPEQFSLLPCWGKNQCEPSSQFKFNTTRASHSLSWLLFHQLRLKRKRERRDSPSLSSGPCVFSTSFGRKLDN